MTVMSVEIQHRTCPLRVLKVHTRDAHPIAPFQRVPDHGPVCDGQQRFWYLLGSRCECAERRARPAQYESLEARGGQGIRMRHCM